MRWVRWAWGFFVTFWVLRLGGVIELPERQGGVEPGQGLETRVERLEQDVMCLRQVINNYGMQTTHCDPIPPADGPEKGR